MCLDSMAPISLTEDGQGTTLQERNYMGLSDCPSFESTLTPNSSLKKELLNIKATELRLGLPGSQSPIRDSNFCLSSHSKLDEKLLFPLSPMKDTVFSPSLKNIISGNKRGFTDAILASRSSSNVEIKTSPVEDQLVGLPPRVLQDRTHNRNESNHNQIVPPIKNNSLNSPASKAQVVGWPPIRSFRKNTLATSSKINEEADGGPYSGVLFVKVSMDGAPYLRKVDLRTYSSYLELSSGLEKMFSGCNLGQCGPHGVGRDMLSEGKVKDLLHGSEYAVTYEDKDGDWMLVGDVPWEMFVDSCQRMRIMKSSDAIGLAPRATEKCDPAP